MGFVVAFVIAAIATPVAMRVARRFDIFDRPGPLKVHTKPVPYLGGAAVFVAVGVVLAPSHPSWLVPLSLACALGIADDRFGVNVFVRLGAQIGIGCIAGIVVPAPDPAGWVVTAVLVVGLMNAVNLIDGLDALAGGVVAAALVALSTLEPELRSIALPVAGALAAFLIYNRPPARIYLGDGGAYFLGTVLGMLLALSLHGGSAHWFAAPLFVAVPVIDTAIAIFRRLRSRRPVTSGDRSHVYDQLVDRGWTRGRVALACIATQLVVGGVAAAAWRLELGAAVAISVVAATMLVLSAFRLGFLNPAGAS
ncbi:MAG TPA: MraY family glycosyltransferase [Acidimicrobiia bacterium]|nr:MraY family glycosyltransferase [Acidimicrobiia bacterium]